MKKKVKVMCLVFAAVLNTVAKTAFPDGIFTVD